MIKRLFDVVASATALVLLTPVLVLIAFAVKVDSRGPVFFRQWRIGRHQTLFRVVKFRTMINGAADRGPTISIAGDLRVTAVGRFLRRFELDELPTLINVVKGEMSIVGPRPEVPKYLSYYEGEYKEILSVRPGMTDPGTLQFRDEAKLLTSTDSAEDVYVNKILPEKLKLNLEYTQRRSMRFDMNIILKTLALIAMRPKG